MSYKISSTRRVSLAKIILTEPHLMTQFAKLKVCRNNHIVEGKLWQFQSEKYIVDSIYYFEFPSQCSLHAAPVLALLVVNENLKIATICFDQETVIHFRLMICTSHQTP